jgi:hypothetical protein
MIPIPAGQTGRKKNDGNTTKEIAGTLVISLKAVDYHRDKSTEYADNHADPRKWFFCKRQA